MQVNMFLCEIYGSLKLIGRSEKVCMVHKEATARSRIFKHATVFV